MFAELELAGAAELELEGLSRDAIEFSRQIDMRYVGQSYELTIPTPGRFEASSVQQLLERFHAEHDRSYGFSAPTEPTECVSLRLTAVGRIAKPPLQPLDSTRRRRAQGAPPRLLRRVRATTSTARSTTATRCPPAGRIAGPAVIEEFDSTTVLHPGYAAEIETYGNLIIRRET